MNVALCDMGLVDRVQCVDGTTRGGQYKKCKMVEDMSMAFGGQFEPFSRFSSCVRLFPVKHIYQKLHKIVSSCLRAFAVEEIVYDLILHGV